MKKIKVEKNIMNLALTLLKKHFFFSIMVFVIFLNIIFLVWAISSDLKVKNEYLYLDEMTILNNHKVVSNSEYTRDNLILDVKQLTKPEKFNSLNVFNHGTIGINQSTDFVFFPDYKFFDISNPRSRFHFLVSGKNREFTINFRQTPYLFLFNQQLFHYISEKCTNRNEFIEFKVKHNQPFINTEDKNALECYSDNISYMIPTAPLIQADTEKKFKEKLDFVEKNLDEKLLQYMARYYFHETSFVLSPINEIKLGKPLNEVFSQYGFLSILTVSQVMDWLGGFSYPNFNHAMKLFYLLYFLAFLLVIFSMFKDVVIRSFMVLIAMLGLFLNGYSFFDYAPGIVPIRHFFDLFVIFFVWKFLHTNRRIYLIIALIFVVLSIFTNKEYGMLMGLAFIGALVYEVVFKSLKEHVIDYKFLALALTSVVVIGLSLLSYPLATNPSSKYFLDGFYSFPLQLNIFAIVLFAIFAEVMLLLFFAKHLYKNKLLSVYVLTALYSQLLYFYFVWGGGYSHFYPLMTIFILPIVIFISSFDYHKSKIMVIGSYGIIGVLFLVTLFYGFNFYSQILNSKKVFKDHVVYDWQTSRAEGMKTTFNPDVFEDSINIIKKYSPKNKIYMISKYDNILAILSTKYSGLNFFELRSSLVTKDEYEKAVKDLLLSELIYVDNDINRDFSTEENSLNLWNLIPGNFVENKSQRIPKLKVLKKLYFDVIPNNYKLIHKGKLISVYERNK